MQLYEMTQRSCILFTRFPSVATSYKTKAEYHNQIFTLITAQNSFITTGIPYVVLIPHS